MMEPPEEPPSQDFEWALNALILATRALNDGYPELALKIARGALWDHTDQKSS